MLQFRTDKFISLSGGIKTGVRTWLKDLLPDVELENGRGTENVYLNYENSDIRISLTRKAIDQPVWELPSDIKTNKGFYLKIEGEDVKGGQLKNYIIDSLGKLEALDERVLPARDEFGQVVSKENNPMYVIGSNLFAIDDRRFRLRQSLHSFIFKPLTAYGEYDPNSSKDLSSLNDLLVTFLTVKRESNVKDYFDAFESVYQMMFGPKEIESHPIELSRLKRWSLNTLDYMGILDYEYTSKKIIVNPPQFLLIPTHTGRTVLLIGGRTTELIQKIKFEAEKEGLHLNIEPQDSSLIPFILPPTVKIVGFDENNGKRIEKKFRKVAEACSISFDPEKLPSSGLLNFQGVLMIMNVI
jgi:hypothetical protein